MTTSPSATAPLANDTRATSPSCSKPVPRCPVCTTPAGNAPGQHFDEVGAMHAEGRVPARGVRHLDRRDRRAVVAKIVRTVADPGAPLLHRRSETHALQMPHAVRRQEDPGPDLSERRRLLIDGNIEAIGNQRVRGKQAANSASDDHDTELRLRHRPTQKMLRKLARSSYPSLLRTPSADSSDWTE